MFDNCNNQILLLFRYQSIECLLSIVCFLRQILPHNKHIEVSCGQIQALLLSSSKAKAHSENGQGQGQQTSKDEEDGPQCESTTHAHPHTRTQIVRERERLDVLSYFYLQHTGVMRRIYCLNTKGFTNFTTAYHCN